MIKKYGADATRIALADAGDGITDANLEEDVADNNVLRLFNLREWCEEIVKDQDQLRTGDLNSFQDALFNNEMNSLVAEAQKHYEVTDYKLALKAAYYDFTNARDFYREACSSAGIKLHKDLALRYIELQALILAVVAPHFSEYIWLEVLHRPGTIQNARYPVVPPADAGLTAAREYVRQTASNVNSAEAAQQKKKAKGKDIAFDPTKPKKLIIFVSDRFPPWQEKYMDLVRGAWDPSTQGFKGEKEVNDQVKKMGEMKKAMPFVQNLKRRLQQGEPADKVLERKLPFDEIVTLNSMVPALKKTAGLKVVELVQIEEGGKKGKVVGGDGEGEKEGLPPQAESAVPGLPTFAFENVE